MVKIEADIQYSFQGNYLRVCLGSPLNECISKYKLNKNGYNKRKNDMVKLHFLDDWSQKNFFTNAFRQYSLGETNTRKDLKTI